MNSYTNNSSQKGGPTSSSLNAYQFDFGLGSASSRSASSRSLKDQKLPQSTTPTPSKPWTHQPSATAAAKPSWSHQPAPRSGLPAASPSSMVGDIFGKSWSSSSSSSSSAAAAPSLGIPKSDPNLFGDLLGSALGSGMSSGNVPLKAAPARNSYSMGSLSDALPKSTTTTTTTTVSSAAAASGNLVRPGFGSADNLGNLSSFHQSGTKIGNPMGGGGAPMKSGAKKDPFGSLVDFGSKNSGNSPLSSVNSSTSGNGGGDFGFGDFQNAKTSDFGIPPPAAAAPKPQQQKVDDFHFGAFQDGGRDDFAMPAAQKTEQPKGGADPLDMLFSSSVSSVPSSAAVSGSEPFSEMNDWDVAAEFGGHDDSGGTTELEGLPPPPAGVSALAAKTKGMDNYKGGQYADAIKWLSWAIVLIEKSGDSGLATEVLSCRASCYKEVGEYKKAVADCSKVLETESTNVSVLLQRALLYESTEKYRLGAEDLRTVLKIDPGNRLAKSTIHRLNKMAD